MDQKWRHEDKYVLPIGWVVILQSRLAGLLRPDPHVGAAGCYQVRSVYFDNRDFSCYREIIAGTDPREKFRIRIYGGDRSRIALELKQKRKGLVHKQSCLISEDVCRMLLRGKRPPMDVDAPPLLKKLALLIETRGFAAKTIVDYTRHPYICAAGNVRVTFDLDVASSFRVGDFLDETIPRYPAMPNGQHVLEIKWDEFLPDYIRQALQVEGLNKQSFSKYAICHNFSKNSNVG